MKKSGFIIILFLFISFSSKGRDETILFNLKFGFIKGGEARLVVSDIIFDNKEAIHYYFSGKTTGLTDKLYGVNDVYETTVDAKTRLPLKSIRNIKEGKYRWYNETLYYHENDSIYSLKSGGRKVPENLVDIISVSFYFIHHHLLDDMQPNSVITMPTFHADKIDNVSVKYLGDEVIETGLGKIDCFVLTPTVDKGKLLKRSDGLRFYISKKSKLPVLLEFDMRLGSLRAELESYIVDGKVQKAE